MADPVTTVAIAIANGATGLALKCASVAKSLNNLTNKHTKANLAIMAMNQELDTIGAAWSRIRGWYRHTKAETSEYELLNRLHKSLECGQLMAPALQDNLLPYRGGTKKLGFIRHSKAIWNENLLQAHQDRIRGQVVAVILLLQVIQLYVMHFPHSILMSAKHLSGRCCGLKAFPRSNLEYVFPASLALDNPSHGSSGRRDTMKLQS